MEPLSVSKGCFVYKNGATRADKYAKKPTKRKNSLQSVGNVSDGSVPGREVTEQPFYSVYLNTWQRLQAHIDLLQQQKYARTLEELVEYILNESDTDGAIETCAMTEILPAAALLTGINQPDHLEQFATLSKRITESAGASVCVLQSRDCGTLKAAIETLVHNFVEAPHEDDEDRDHKRLRRSQCTMKHLQNWYRNNFAQQCSTREDDDYDVLKKAKAPNNGKQRHLLVVILPDFECFSSAVLQDLILVLNAYITQLPFVLVMGVATAVSAVHSSLPYHVTSKIKLRVFQTQSAPIGLNEILEKVILSPKYVFHLSGKTFKFLTHIFLYYDFSINGFIQGFKYCLMEHFFQGNAYSLCASYTVSLTKIKSLTHDDMEAIRHLLSFRPYVERINDCKRIIAILTDDNYLKKKLPQLLRDCQVHFMLRRTFLELLTVLVGDLPKCPLGKYRRELYAFCLSKELSTQAEFKECWQILSFMSKDEFVGKISAAIKCTQEFLDNEMNELELATDCAAVVNEQLHVLKELLTKIVMAGMEVEMPTPEIPPPDQQLQQLSSRQDLKERLLQLSKQSKPTSAYTKSLQELLTYIQAEIVERHMMPLQRAPPLHELFVFTDIATVRRHIIGAPRAALHLALNNPHYYLQCKCCQLREQTQLLPTLPDISVAYKLHLECGRMINLFDWLQAFRSVVDYGDEEQEQVDPQIQARFTRAVAELQFLGYIKMSKRKTDHATRLTW